MDHREKRCDSPGCCGPTRREFLEIVGLGAAVALAAGVRTVAAADKPAFADLIPADKKLDPRWLKSLVERGARTVYRGAELEKIGMPVSGICTGQLYLGGDGKLWHWDIFNQSQATGDAHYAHPVLPSSPLDQGFAVRITSEGKSTIRALDRSGFTDITFCGEYPIGFVEYRDPSLPAAISLEAYSTFIPLNASDSNLPATVMRFTVKNDSTEKIEVELCGWLENAVCLHSGQAGVTRINRVVERTLFSFINCTAQALTPDSEREPIVLADFDGDTYGEWKAEGEAFGKAPAAGAMGNDQRLSGFQGKGLVNSYQASDQPQGKLTSPEFKIERPFLRFLIGGGNHPRETCINLLVDGNVVRTATAKNSDAMLWENWDVRELANKTARLEIVDHHSGGWGHIDIDQIELADSPRLATGPVDQAPDFGSMGLALLDSQPNDLANAALPEANVPPGLFAESAKRPAIYAMGTSRQRLRGALGRKLSLAPGAQSNVTFVIAWNFPNLRLDGLPGRTLAFCWALMAHSALRPALSASPM